MLRQLSAGLLVSACPAGPVRGRRRQRPDWASRETKGYRNASHWLAAPTPVPWKRNRGTREAPRGAQDSAAARLTTGGLPTDHTKYKAMQPSRPIAVQCTDASVTEVLWVLRLLQAAAAATARLSMPHT